MRDREQDLTWAEFKAANPREGDTVKRSISYESGGITFGETSEFVLRSITGGRTIARGGQVLFGATMSDSVTLWSIVKRAPRVEPPYGTVVPLRNSHYEGFYIRTANGWDVFEKALNSRGGYTLSGLTWYQVEQSDRVVWDQMVVPG